jgi:ABC-type glycerol-3-phosphate transport system substrate-binding protein
MASLAAISESGRSGRASEMTTRRAALAGMLALPLALAACGENFDADIQAVKTAAGPGGTNEQFANQLAGARGQVAWSASKPAAYKDNPNVVEVVAKVEKTTRAGAKRTVEIAWINNRQTRQVALERLAIDGQPQSLVSGALGLLMMQLE